MAIEFMCFQRAEVRLVERVKLNVCEFSGEKHAVEDSLCLFCKIRTRLQVKTYISLEFYIVPV